MTMAKTKKKGITREQLWKIWTQVSPQAWLDIARSFKPNHGFNFASQGILKGICPDPDHHDTTPSFYAHVTRGFCKCYGCGLYLSNPVQLVAMMMDSTESEAMTYLQETFKFGFLSKKSLQELEAQRINQETKQTIYAMSHQYMCDALVTPAKFPAAQVGVDWLTVDRKIPADILSALPVGILPPLAELQTMVANAYLAELKAWKQSEDQLAQEPLNLGESITAYLAESSKSSRFNGAIVWPLHVTPREIGRLKFRVPSNSNPKQIIIPEDEFENLLGLYGLGWSGYQDFVDPKNHVTFAYLTEGEMDVMSLMARVAKSGNISIPLLSVGGRGGAAHIEPILQAAGLDTAYLIGDSPLKGASGGDPIVQSWLEKMPKTHTRVFTAWPDLAPAGDLDEAVNQLGESKVLKVVYKKAEENFTPSWKWAYDRAAEEIEGIQEDDQRKRHEAAAAHGKYLANKTDCDVYVDTIAEDYELRDKIIKREIVASEDSELGFIERCVDAIQDHMRVVGTRSMGNALILICYNLKSGRYHQFRLDDERSIAQEIATISGSLYEFAKENVGFPSFFTLPGDGAHAMPGLDGKLRFYLKEAIASLTPGAPDYDYSTHLRQGYHRVPLDNGAYLEYVVCGRDVFAMDRDISTLTYRKLDAPSEHDLIFDIGLEANHRTPPWFPGGLTPKILEELGDANTEELFNTVEDIYDSAFKFKNHKTMKTFVATLPFIIPIMDAFPKPLMLFVSGETHSGKSKLVSTFIDHDRGMRDARLIFCSQGMGSYTEASMAAKANNDRRLVVLDEFESSEGTQKSYHVMNIFELYRPMINGEVVRARSTRSGNYYEAHLRHPIIFSAIVPAQKAQDLNRVIHIEMQKEEGHPSPEHIIKDKYSDATLHRIARELSVCLYKHVPEILENYKVVAEEYYRRISNTLPVRVEERWASHLFPAMALLRFFGRDWEQFFRDFVDDNRREISMATSISESEQIYNGLMRNYVIHTDRESPAKNLNQLLANGNEAEYINDCGMGVYYDAETKLLAFLIDGIYEELLPYRFRKNMQPIQVRAQLQRSAKALSEEEITKSGILTRSQLYFGRGVTTNDVVVVKVDQRVTSERALDQEIEKQSNVERSDVEEEEFPTGTDPNDVDWDIGD
jgi:hypothetical protein